MFLLIFLCNGDVINVYCFNFRVKIKILLCMGVWGCFGVKKKYYGYVYCKYRLKELKCYDFI